MLLARYQRPDVSIPRFTERKRQNAYGSRGVRPNFGLTYSLGTPVVEVRVFNISR